MRREEVEKELTELLEQIEKMNLQLTDPETVSFRGPEWVRRTKAARTHKQIHYRNLKLELTKIKRGLALPQGANVWEMLEEAHELLCTLAEEVDGGLETDEGELVKRIGDALNARRIG